MKITLRLSILLLLLVTIITSCSNTVDNKITIRNLASNKIYFNFRASVVEVNPGSSIEITEIPKGTFTYETTYEIPAGTITPKSEGATSGDLKIQAGTKALIIYSSTFADGVYTLSATLTTSDDINDTGDTDPLNP